MKINKTILGLGLTLLLTATAFAAAAWPASTSGTNIASGLSSYNSGFEASGLTYHDLYGYLVVGDDGDIGILDSSGTVLDYANIGGDFEGITVADQTSDYAYIASENRNSILEIDLSTLTLTGKEWELDLTRSGGWGFEAIAWVPASYAPSSWGTASNNGFFIASSQADKNAYVYNIDTRSTGTSTYTHIDSIYTHYTDTAGMHFSPETELLYVLHDSANKMKEFDLNGNIISSYNTPTTAAEEGIYLAPDCAAGTGTIGFSDDGGATTTLYTNYPLTCDEDGDGVDATIDCDDDDASIQYEVDYFLDNDGDRLGNPAISTSLCSLSVPAGYAPNSADTNDNVPNWGIEIQGDGIDNDGVDTDGDWAPDGDGEIDEENTVAENGYHPYYSTLAPNLSIHYFTITGLSTRARKGELIVNFQDKSTYAYPVFSSHFTATLTHTRLGNSAYVGVSNRRKSKKINALTGETVFW